MWLLCFSSISPTKKVTIFNPTLWVGQNLPSQLLVKSFARPWLDIHQRNVRAQMQRAPISTVRGTSLWTGSLVWSFASFNLCFLSLFDWTSSDLYKHKHSCVNAPWKQKSFWLSFCTSFHSLFHTKLNQAKRHLGFTGPDFTDSQIRKHCFKQDSGILCSLQPWGLTKENHCLSA